MIKGKTPEEIRKLFNIVNDFTPEEEVSSCLSFVRALRRFSDFATDFFRLRSRRKMYVLAPFILDLAQRY